MRKEVVIVWIGVCIANISVAVTTEQIEQVREFVSQKATPSEKQTHWKATLLALRSFARTLEIPDPNLSDPLSMKPSENKDHSIYLLYQDAYQFCEAYKYKPEAKLSVDPNKLTDSQRQAMFSETANMLEQMENELVDRHINTLTLPLIEELRKELNQPTLTYVSFDGIQRNAITERAKNLYDRIIAMKNTKSHLLLSINDHYCTARITILECEKECSREQAKRVVDAWFDHKLKEIERTEDAENRRGKGIQRMQQQQKQLLQQERQPFRPQYPQPGQSRRVNGGIVKEADK